MNFPKYKISPISGDASTRKFFRLLSYKKNKILVFSSKEKYKNLTLYTAVNKYLRKNKILAPKLYSYDFSRGFIIIEDFGDTSFYKILLKKKNKFTTYKKIVDLLIKIQKIKPKSKIKISGKKFHIIEKYSNKYLFEESDLFFKWYLPLFLSKKKALNIKKISKKILLKLYNKLNYRNSFLVHRDFHSQNLMKVGKKIGVIDTQDALIGNQAYDLVSLIDDVRLKTSDDLKNKIFNYYLKKISKIKNIDSIKFLEDFNILSVQRSLKILGIFSRLSIRDKKKTYLKFMPYTRYLLKKRMKSEIFSELKEILNASLKKK
tara:strand:+ start:106 stop:1059 length:954 start_codon:yes stop_codon:yes gene_type:complete